MDATNPPFTVKEPQPTSFVGDFVAKVIREYDEATEAMIPDIIGGIVYNSTPPAEMLALRNAELERRAA